MAFSKKTWLNEEDAGATDENSVLNKTNMNDLENRINNAFNDKITGSIVNPDTSKFVLQRQKVISDGKFVTIVATIRLLEAISKNTQFTFDLENVTKATVATFSLGMYGASDFRLNDIIYVMAATDKPSIIVKSNVDSVVDSRWQIAITYPIV